MRQFDVCRLRNPPHNLVVVLQHDLADGLQTRIVAPLSGVPQRLSIDKLRLSIDFGMGEYSLQLDRLAAVRSSDLGAVVGTLKDIQDRIKAGLDLLFLGV